MAKKRRPEIFSITKAVKRNARDRVGQPPPSHPLPDPKTREERRASKHRWTLSRMVEQAQGGPGEGRR